ncbi:hypothetical protein CHUAL_008087 [Chamberlinius hualienensis]
MGSFSFRAVSFITIFHTVLSHSCYFIFSVGMMRYSFPSCLRYGKEGDYCLGNSQPRNVTLYYPNGLQLDLSEVHTLFCPCDATMALSCRQGTCQSRIDTDTSNVI